MGVGAQCHTQATLPPGKTWYPLYRRLGGPQGRTGRHNGSHSKTQERDMIQRYVQARSNKGAVVELVSTELQKKTTLSRVTEDSKSRLRARQRSVISGGSTCLLL